MRIHPQRGAALPAMHLLEPYLWTQRAAVLQVKNSGREARRIPRADVYGAGETYLSGLCAPYPLAYGVTYCVRLQQGMYSPQGLM